MPVSLTISGVPDETRDALATRAASAGQSLEDYVHARLVELAVGPGHEDLWDRVQQRVGAMRTSLASAEILDLLSRDRT